MESSGPEGGKVRGPAAMIHERYLQLARDAAGSSGDRVLSENYLQHADHYFRLWRASQPATPPPQMNDRFADEGAEGDDAEGAEMEGAEEGEASAEGADQPDVDFPQGQQQQNFDRDGDQRGRNRGRGRRGRYRPDGEGGGEPREAREGEGGEERREAREDRGERQPREERGERRERRPSREPRDENAGPEGFSNGPKPAFLRGGD